MRPQFSHVFSGRSTWPSGRSEIAYVVDFPSSCSTEYVTVDPSSLKMGWRSFSGVAVRAVSLPVLRSLSQTSWFPERKERNTSLLPSADIEAFAFGVKSFVIRSRSCRTLPSRGSIRTDQMSILRVKVENAICDQRSPRPAVPAASDGCSSSPVPIVSRSGVPDTRNDLGEIGTFHRFVVSPVNPEKTTSSCDQAP